MLERHNVPGGCASFFQRAGYRFDVGATLVSGFGVRGVHRRLFEQLEIEVAATPVEPAMDVHLPDVDVRRFGDARWGAERRRVFGDAAEPFWQRQEQIAELAWDFSGRFPMLPADATGVRALAAAFRPRHLPLAALLGRTVASIMPPGEHRRLRAFVDAQLLITAQTDAAHADLAYGATALDLAREGTVHLPDGVSSIAVALARALRRAGGSIRYNTTVDEVVVERGTVRGVRCGGELVRADRVIAAIPIADVARLAGADAPFARRAARRPQRWSAFMAYVALPAGVVPDDLALHHQVVLDDREPPGEGNTVFASFSGPDEIRRARGGGRALTLSTHTDAAAWERAWRDGTEPARRLAYAARLRTALERVLPGAWDAAAFVELATPHTFERYTGRAHGLVGGVPQTAGRASLGAFSHVSGIGGLVLAGDTVFPGQSTVGASLSGVAAARACGARIT